MVHRSRSYWPLVALAAAILVADQVTKYAVDTWMSPSSLIVVIPGVLNLVRTSNPGVAFGFFAESGVAWRAPVLIIFAVVVIGMIVWLLATGRAGGWLGRYGMTSILGGAAGNVLDRLAHHGVTDFIDLHLGRYHWYTFNLADSAIVVGAALVILELLQDTRHSGADHA